MDEGRGGGSENVDWNFFVFLRPFKGSFRLFNACLGVFCLFLPKKKKKFKIPIYCQ